MGQTSECIEWGMDCGLEGLWDKPTHMPSKVGDYLLPFIDGYRHGFRLRKAGVTEKGKITDAQAREDQRLWRLMELPMYPQPWEKC